MSIKTIVFAAAAIVGYGAWADYTTSRVISINFGSGNGTAEEGSGLISVSAQAWNNLSAESNTRNDLVTWTGSAAESLSSNWSVTWSCATLYQYTTDVSDPILKGYLDDGGDGVSITVSSIPFAKYDLYIYQATDNGSGFNPPSVNGTYYSLNGNETSMTRNDTALKYGAQGSATAKIGTNVICLQKGFTASTLEIKGGGNANSARGCIAAIQIVEVTDPTQDSISVNIAGGNSSIASESITEGYAGAFRMAGANWNNFSARSDNEAVNVTETNVKEVLADGCVISGSVIPVKVKLRAACCYAAAGSYTHASNPGKLLWGYLDDGETDSSGKGAKVEVTGIPYTQYDLYVYCGSDNNGNFGLITVNDTTYPTDATDSMWGEHVKAHETNKWLDLEEGGNYIKVTGLTAETLAFQGAKVAIRPARVRVSRRSRSSTRGRAAWTSSIRRARLPCLKLMART